MRHFIEKNFFEVLDLPVSYHVDELELTDRYFKKYKQYDSGDISSLNEAYKTLMNPVDRAEYIINLYGLRVDEICSESAVEMFEIREKYDSLSSQSDKKKFQVFLRQRISEIIKLLHELDESSKEFFSSVCLLRFIHSFLEKIGENVYNRD